MKNHIFIGGEAYWEAEGHKHVHCLNTRKENRQCIAKTKRNKEVF